MTQPIRLVTVFLGLAALEILPADAFAAWADPTATHPAQGSLKIATVDMQELFKQYYRTNEAQKQINVERARIQKDNNERMAKIRDLETALGKLSKQLEDPALAASKKQALYKDWQLQQQEGIALDRERREFLQRRNQMLNEKMLQRMKGILEEIRKLVEEHAKTGNFDYVFDKSGMSTSQVPFLLYTKDATDITAVLLKGLNKDAPAESLPESSVPAPNLSKALVPPMIEPPAKPLTVRGMEVRQRADNPPSPKPATATDSPN